ncbi:MAG: queuosine precursor transporter [Bifidobacteriaceae bacterium]|jgi:uncharacterized integral membrane protein (TIGR00697 family)|nr:queuosine precursor transporter [Bifidobacteriaceae bacterium]
MRADRYYDVTLAIFVALFLVSNIAATKLINVGTLIFDGGALLFPLTYILGDVLSEVYGFKKASRAIFVSFFIGALASVSFWIIDVLPVAPSYEYGESFHAILGFLPRIVAASLAAYLVGQLINAFVLTKVKQFTHEKHLWFRLLSSTLIGELADTLIFCTIAFYGIITGSEFLNYLLTGYVYKCAIEILLLPVTYRVIRVYEK